MTSRSDTGSVGNREDAAYIGNPTCPDGEYVSRIFGGAGRYLDRICATCSDGTELGCIGNTDKETNYSYNGPFQSIWGNAGRWVDSVFGSGGDGGGPYGLGCPDEHVIVGIHGSSGDIVNEMGFTCGVDKNTYCLNHVDEAVCTKISKEVLNKACAKNMGTLCRDRRNELNESVVQTFCDKNPNDPMCSCYKKAPDYIPAELRGLPSCWNDTCATKGFIPVNMRGPCPSMVICQQNLPTGGDSNVLSKNLLVQSCSSASLGGTSVNNPSGAILGTGTMPNQGSTATTAIQTATGAPIDSSVGVVQAGVTAQNTISNGFDVVGFFTENPIYLVIIFAIFIAVVYVAITDPEDKQPLNINGQPQQPVYYGPTV